MVVRKAVFVLSSLIVLFGVVNSANAVTLFDDDFASYGSGANFRSSITNGTSGWSAGRFQSGDGATIDEIGLFSSGGGTLFAGFEDDAGILFHINTVGLTDVNLSFDWRTFDTDSGDSFEAGYYAGDISGDFNAQHVADFQGLHGSSWYSNFWTSIASGRSGSFINVNYLLPSGVSDLWVAFWLNNGDGDIGLLDNVLVTANGNGNEIPEPATILLFSAGLIGAARFRRDQAV